MLTLARQVLLSACLATAALWYLSHNPAAGRAVAGVLILGLTAAVWLRRARTVRLRRRLRTLGDLLTLSPSQFEEAVADVLSRSSFRRVRVVGAAADLGIDITCLDRKGRTVIVQCKRHAPGIAVGSGEVQRFLGSMIHSQADRGVLVTTSRFSGPAREIAEHHGIDLVDGEALVEMVRRINRRRQPATIH